MACMQALLVGLPAGRRGCWRGKRVGVGLLDSKVEMDRELEKAGRSGRAGGWGGGQV